MKSFHSYSVFSLTHTLYFHSPSARDITDATREISHHADTCNKSYLVSKVSPTLGCSIEICVIYVYTRKRVFIKKRASSFPIVICHPDYPSFHLRFLVVFSLF